MKSVDEVDSQKFAVLKFSGFGSAKTFEKKIKELEKFLTQQNLLADGSSTSAYYNPPWTLPFLRRNEVMIPIKEELRVLY